MKLIDLKEWVNSLPEEVMNCEVVYRKCFLLPSDDEDSGEYLGCEDIPIQTMLIDTQHGEACLLDEDSIEIADTFYDEEQGA